MMQDMTGKAVWVTGAGSGIGRAIALAFAGAGCRVAITGRRAAPLQETAGLIGTGALVLPADVADQTAVAAACAAAEAAFGRLDVLVNNAGINTSRRHWRDLSPAAMGALVDVNLKGPFLCTLAALPGMRAQGGGTLIHIVSNAATGIYPVSGPAYIAAKHGARAMSASLNAEEGIHGIRSICINPGEVATPLMEDRPRPPTAQERALMVQPEDIAAAALFAARMPVRTCVAEMLVNPTDNAFFRRTARALAGES